MTSNSDTQQSHLVNRKYLELAVPLVAFGITGTGILLWGAGYAIDFQYVSTGCLISSCILAYLAWIRPRKDIVALSTPIYGIVFLSTPIEAAAGAVLQLLYAAGLTILLIRLKRKFSEDLSGSGALSPDEPLGRYRDRLTEDMLPVSPALARNAGRVFIRFAEGEYEQARKFAQDAGAGEETPTPVQLERAFAIVAEQTGHMVEGSPIPAEYHAFSVEQRPLLFHPVNETMDRDTVYGIELENALLLLYVAALESREREVLSSLDKLRPFARKLCSN